MGAKRSLYLWGRACYDWKRKRNRRRALVWWEAGKGEQGMDKVLYYGMTGEKMCFQHILMNALDLAADGKEVKIIFEGASVGLVPVFEEENHPLYNKAKALGLIAGVCLACSKVMGVYEQNKNTGLAMLEDMNGHAGMKRYLYEDYRCISM